MKFNLNGKNECNSDGIKAQFGIYFPYDKEMCSCVALDDKDLVFLG